MENLTTEELITRIQELDGKHELVIRWYPDKNGHYIMVAVDIKGGDDEGD